MENKFTEYKLTQRYGMEATGDMWQDWATEEEIKQESENFSQYVEECKAKGIYGQEYTTIIMMEQDPLFDKPTKNTTESYRFEIIDFGKL